LVKDYIVAYVASYISDQHNSGEAQSKETVQRMSVGRNNKYCDFAQQSECQK